jgi:hypothetical protein
MLSTRLLSLARAKSSLFTHNTSTTNFIIPITSSTSSSSTPQQVQSFRWYTPMSKDEEEAEKVRVSKLTAFDKEQELRKLNREVARLEMLRGINTGELYTWTGRYKKLATEYGLPLTGYYAVCWFTTACMIYGSITVFDVDVLMYIAKADAYFDWDLARKIDPKLGTIGATIVLNELVEPIRLPFVILTVKPVVDKLFPDHIKY